ncbi:prepilin-type N-terminal cleavage/methylation domain-containing protein [Alkalimonas collagenimarina]|uniref:Prepilin-type N-terminal cleavage/methylation domain-containing protein n=1 Tax=Alkalimonas collagenimarina TaxID=400390 RepID=A0ABT9H0L0_9GAMM|nr:prepilin-type N-terminal cleavage/methylation domain-containing protein [Alkalimonas collagenimarina]MDP4536855.1 prepilin-type N-terminal cleavage/methylation domain-containing protein [Alkalimonas collagenimarina]
MTAVRIEMNTRAHHQRGVSLVELMIAMMLGVILIGGVMGVFLSTQQTYRVNDSLNRMQDGFRVGFQLLTRDLRNAGSSGCTNNGRVVNVLAGNAWWADWGGSNFMAYDGDTAYPGVAFGTGVGQRVSGTSAIQMMYSLSDGDEAIAIAHVPSGVNASFQIAAGANIAQGDIVMVCDQSQSTIFQVSNITGGGVNVIHNTGNTTTPGNCTNRLGFPGPTSCSASAGTAYVFPPNAVLSKFESVSWFVGHNGRPATGGQSLYRTSVEQGNVVVEEVIEGVVDVQFEFLLLGANSFIATNAVPANRWIDVVSSRLTVTVESPHDNMTDDGNRLNRTIVHEVALRNPVL